MFDVFRCSDCTHREPTLELLPFDPELEKTLRKLKKTKVNKSGWRLYKMGDKVKALSTRMIYLKSEIRLWGTVGSLCLMITIQGSDNSLLMQTILS